MTTWPFVMNELRRYEAENKKLEQASAETRDALLAAVAELRAFQLELPTTHVQHGRLYAIIAKFEALTLTCEKAPHVLGGGYLHAEDDDTPYFVDHVQYCGRCHAALPHKAP